MMLAEFHGETDAVEFATWSVERILQMEATAMIAVVNGTIQCRVVVPPGVSREDFLQTYAEFFETTAAGLRAELAGEVHRG